MKWVMWFVIAFIIALGVYAVYVVIDITTQTRNDNQLEIKKRYEQAYFEGQRDAIGGDVRVRKINNRIWVWTKSPYDDTTRPYKDTILSKGAYQ